MTRPLRIQYDGAFYHIICRGIEKRDIYSDNQDRFKFLKILKESKEIYHVNIHCYAMMTNHFHLVVETLIANLSEFMRRFNITYTYYFNRKYDRNGPLYQGRYKSILVEKESYLDLLGRYIHLNPVQAKENMGKSFSEKEIFLIKYKWSSLPWYAGEEKGESFLTVDAILEGYGGNSPSGHTAYWSQILRDLDSRTDITKYIVGGCLLGTDGFIEKIKRNYIKKDNREVSAAAKIRRYKTKEVVIKVVIEILGIEFVELKKIRGVERQILMEALYRFSDLNSKEIGELLGVDYSTVSIGRKRFRQRLSESKELNSVLEEISSNLSIIKI